MTDMKIFCRKGDLIRLLVPTTSQWQGIGIAAEKVYDMDNPNTIVPFYRQDQDLEDQAVSIALISEVELVRPTNRQIDRLYWQCEQNPQGYRELIRKFLARFSSKPGSQQSRPIPLEERDPVEADCDANGCCWFYDHGMWVLDTWQGNYSHWLPYWALPAPKSKVEQ